MLVSAASHDACDERSAGGADGQNRDAAAVRVDLRLVALGAAGWAGALLVLLGPRWLAPSGIAIGLAVLVLCVRRRGAGFVVAGCVVAATAVGGSSLVRLESMQTGPVARLAEARAVVSLHGRVASDPLLREGRFGEFVVVRLQVTDVVGRGRSFRTDVPVVVIADERWSGLALGDTVETSGRLAPPEDLATSAVLHGTGSPVVVRPAGEVLGAAEAVRAGIRRAVTGSSPEARQLVPALVVGDDRAMSPRLVEDFRACGLTHLAAVSGTNLTLVVGFLLLLARWCGVRARGLVLVGVLGVAGFVLVARSEPSVVRAAAMGTVALLGMGANGRHTGVRALGAATLALLLVDPWLAVSFGFVLSVLATAGILFLAPVFRDQLRTWLPRWAAEAVAVPLAAQLVCTPVVAALSDQVSIVAVVANLLVAPAVAPATVLGLFGGLATLVAPSVGALLGLGAGACGWWIVAVATQLARLPQAAVDWPASGASLLVLTVVCIALVPASGWVLRRRWATAAACLVLVFGVLRPAPTPGWPPAGWVLVACDVGQGDGIVLNAGDGRAVLIDAGPEPSLVDACLDRLDVRRLPLVVLSHFHADHVGGLSGALDGRATAEVLVSPLPDPPPGADAVDRQAAAAGARVRVPVLGETNRVGDVTWQLVGPLGRQPLPSAGSAANNASLVLLAEVRGVRVLAAGDVEPEGQQELARALPGLAVDILKVPHHGSRHQDAWWLSGLGARVAVVSAGEGNDYGHPAPSTLDVLRGAGALVARTDVMGDVAVVVDADGRLVVRSR